MTQLLLSDCSIVRHFLIHSQQQLQLHAPSIMREFCSVAVVVFWFLRLFVRFDRTRCGRLLIRSFTAIRPRASLVPPSVNTRRHDSNSISRPLDDFTRASSFWRRKKKKPKQKKLSILDGDGINQQPCVYNIKMFCRFRFPKDANTCGY